MSAVFAERTDRQRFRSDETRDNLPVCDQSKRVLDTITDRDLAVRIVATAKPASTLVEDGMTRRGALPGSRDVRFVDFRRAGGAPSVSFG